MIAWSVAGLTKKESGLQQKREAAKIQTLQQYGETVFMPAKSVTIQGQHLLPLRHGADGRTYRPLPTKAQGRPGFFRKAGTFGWIKFPHSAMLYFSTSMMAEPVASKEILSAFSGVYSVEVITCSPSFTNTSTEKRSMINLSLISPS